MVSVIVVLIFGGRGHEILRRRGHVLLEGRGKFQFESQPLLIFKGVLSQGKVLL